MNALPIADGHAVTIHYRLTLDDGSVADESFGGEPLVYLQGHGNIVPGLERQMAGRKVGDAFEAVVPAAEGYGEYDPAAEKRVPKNSFPAGTAIQAGVQFQARGPGGQPQMVWVKAVRGDEIVISSNHPMAGQNLNFRVEVVEVRRATKQELAHGHVHGPHGHDH